MALFTDGPVSGLEDLTALDTQLSNVASVEGIDVTQKIRLAQEELAIELSTMIDVGGDELAVWPKGNGIESVVVTGPLKLWHTYKALELVYRDAYSSQLNDRYRAKWDQFASQGRWAMEKLMQCGIGMARNPVPQARVPLATAMPGGLPDGSYYVAMSWIGANGSEGAASEPAVVDIAAGTLFVNPGRPPATAQGWNVYVGRSPEAMTKQNSTPIATAVSWTQPNSISDTGDAPGTGQEPAHFRAAPRRLWRG